MVFSGSVLACSSVERETLDRVTPHDDTAWTSRDDCEQRLASQPSSSRPPRIASWNIRYFPDAIEGEQTDPDEATDVEWLACAIASLDVDILAVQEFKNSEAGLAQQRALIERLNELTSGDWRLELAQCTPEDVQHPGFLFDRNRVSGSEFRTIPSLNPDPTCSNSVSPGFGGYFAISGGPDIHLVVVHGQTGASQTSFEKRQLITSALEAVTNDAQAINGDTDVLFAGDFNTVGCEACEPAWTNEDEVNELKRATAGFDPPLELLPASERCTRLAEDVPHIDHVLASASMAEVPEKAVVRVAGICEETSCERQVEWLEDAYERLSDHCPLLLDLTAADDD
jgi:endonuclease/exonuclease/phosphatase family metal-dependent hydrolase